MTTTLEYFRTYANRFPRHYVIAADHTLYVWTSNQLIFDCTCTDCLCFLALTAPTDPDVDDAVLHEEVDLLDGCISEAQKARLHSYFSKVC